MGKSRNPTPPPGKPLLFTPDEMIAALRANNGNATATARALECDRSTVLDYCKRFPECQAAREEGVEIRVDKAEKALDDSIELREAWAVQIALRGQGAKRGHAEKSETTIQLDYSKLSTEQLEQIAAGKDPLAVIAGSTGKL